MTTTTNPLTVVLTDDEPTHDRCGVWHPLTPRLIAAMAMKAYSAKFSGVLTVRESDDSVNAPEVYDYLIDLLADEPEDLSDDSSAEWYDHMYQVCIPLVEALTHEGYLVRADEPENDDYWPMTFPDPEGWLTNWSDDAERTSRALDNIAFDVLLADRLSI